MPIGTCTQCCARFTSCQALAIASALDGLSQTNLKQIAVQGNKFTAEARALVGNSVKRLKARASGDADGAADKNGTMTSTSFQLVSGNCPICDEALPTNLDRP